MAIIHGKAASTQYLLDMMPEIEGRKFETLQDIQQFYDNYAQVLVESETSVRKNVFDDIARLEQEEKELTVHLTEGLARKREEIENRIEGLHQELLATKSLFKNIGLRLTIFNESRLKDVNISMPFVHIQSELSNKQKQRLHLIKDKEIIVASMCNCIKYAYRNIENNKTFLIGASGEEEVIQQLSFLPDEYHVINDLKINFDRWVYWKNGNDGDKNIKTSQIDHLVIGPTGIYLIETKKWSSEDIDVKRDDLVYQIRRANYALWYYLKNLYHIPIDVKIQNIAVSVHGDHRWQKIDKFTILMSPYGLCKFILKGDVMYSQDEVGRLVRYLKR